MDINLIIERIQPINQTEAIAAQTRFDDLIKPVGSLAKLEAMVARYAGIIGSAEKKDIQYPKKALLEWSTDPLAIARVMGKSTPASCFANDAGMETYPLLITQEDTNNAMEEGALLVKEYVQNNDLKMLAFGALGTYEFNAQMEKNLSINGNDFLTANNDMAIAAMTGGILEAAALKVPVMLDGIATCLAAIAAIKIAPLAKEYCMVGHVSAEVGMEKLLDYLGMSAPLRLDIDGGAGEGAILACTLFDAGIRAYNEMETFAEAGVHEEVEEFSHAIEVKKKS